MKAEVKEIIDLPNIPSASGIEIYEDKIYVIGDDTPSLFVLNEQLQIIKSIPLFESNIESDGRIKKSKKPDLESLTLITYNDKPCLLVLGSGSIREVRDWGFIIRMTDYSVTKISFHQFYNHLRSILNQLHAGTLNIEASVFYNDKLYLFHRGNISRKNLFVSLTLIDFMGFIESGVAPSLQYYQISLPDISGIASGFSGATLIPGTSLMLFTASVEDTSNVIDDGPALGSFIGILDASLNQSDPSTDLIKYNGGTLNIKLESIVVTSMISDNVFYALACSDEDGKSSSLLKLKITLD